jgi:hypothetical protein
VTIWRFTFKRQLNKEIALVTTDKTPSRESKILAAREFTQEIHAVARNLRFLAARKIA